MSRIAYDPVKDKFARIIRNNRLLRRLFYALLDLFFLRSWYIRHLLRNHSLQNNETPHILDAGCGFGQYDRFMLQQFKQGHITAVDVKEDYLDDCRHYFEESIEQGRIVFKKANLLRWDAPAQYDAAICVDVLEHIEEDVQVMQNIAASLRPGGLFIMHSPSIFSEEDAGSDESFVDEHARTGYSKESITQKLEKAGLSPVDVQYTYGAWGHLAWRMLIKYPMLWMNRVGLWALPLMALWYIPALPFSLLFMTVDLRVHNDKGTGIYAVARKN